MVIHYRWKKEMTARNELVRLSEIARIPGESVSHGKFVDDDRFSRLHLSQNSQWCLFQAKNNTLCNHTAQHRRK